MTVAGTAGSCLALNSDIAPLIVVDGIAVYYAYLHSHSSNWILHTGVVVGPVEQNCTHDTFQHFDRDWRWSLEKSAVDIDRVSDEIVAVN